MNIFLKFKNIVSNEAFGGVLLIIFTILALLVQNGSYNVYYREFLNLDVGVNIGEFKLNKPFLLWINDGLISIFFFCIGLELKKEFLEGDFKNPKNITLPFMAALGGILVPALIFSIVNVGDSYTLRGWAIPTATDTAFSLAILIMVGKSLPSSLKIFLLSLAIFDDVGAILIIAIFYTTQLSTLAFIVVACTIVAMLFLNLFGITRKSFYFICSLILWVSVLKSGVHATLAGIITAFFIPMYRKDGRPFLEEIEHGLRFWTAFIILPLFAFANAGVNLSHIDIKSLFSGVSIGIFLGLFIGKQVGVFAFSYLAIKFKMAQLPVDSNLKQLYGVCILTGIGFTMSLFIDGLAYEVSDIFNYADNLAILIASFCSGIFGYIYLKFFANR
ncbi:MULTISPECIES: Na+/H+ antiporter NhaA [unclassified Campylobacter]|uniref:Na+/H+ antiporter NhaA n=1 Tax=unclassified Campylobacter TaxID=2593542 RepID=UPI0012383841|nr:MULTISPECIES: Na+/H+ antiporter NhaA [unclassified Campylobacter]KAA6225094.1 Na+/H+ antiporter NhaA [Campylobacter sp. LR196d]KAA6226108.1 Na+/H+ antiporter NhaA [Campylobacter sp. LR185c]KAA6228055.1 Na+/H+ antiporter NhaA [Campylobacter sp. LR286c]KAA6231308.1 Na+/H+ antiporter NhaA [Campylobacter sp. LR264d]KAA6231520.1 Na+/H+ antiporter NhaA [Campylobacter sp. LR291e]